MLRKKPNEAFEAHMLKRYKDVAPTWLLARAADGTYLEQFTRECLEQWLQGHPPAEAANDSERAEQQRRLIQAGAVDSFLRSGADRQHVYVVTTVADGAHEPLVDWLARSHLARGGSKVVRGMK